MVKDLSRISSTKSLYSGLRFVPLSNFLGQPYERHATLPRYQPPPGMRQHESFPFATVFNLQDGSENGAQQLTSTEQLQAVDKSAGCLVVLKGYPSSEWLNALGDKFRIDPEFYQRHLCLWSESGKRTSRHIMAPRLPSAQSDTLMLRIPTTGVLTGRKLPNDEADVQNLLDKSRIRTSNDMEEYIGHVSSLDSPKMHLGDSIVREFAMLDLEHFAIEQIISINIVPASNGGWITTVWSDVGRCLDDGPEGPWKLRKAKSESWEMSYQPISIFKPRMAFQGGGRSRTESVPHGQPQSASILFDEYDRDLNTAQAAVDPLYALSPVFRFTLFSEMALVDTLESMIRSELTHSVVFAQESPTMLNLLYNQQILKRHIDSLKEVVEFVERFQKRAAYQSVMDSTDSKSADEITSLLDDFRAVLCRAETLCKECFQGIGIVAHNATIRESQKAVAEARSVTKLTKLALVFVPLSFTTSAFGMNLRELGDESAPSIWVWSIITFGVAFIVYAFFRWNTTQLQAFARGAVAQANAVGTLVWRWMA